jgi:hypothetical protein
MALRGITPIAVVIGPGGVQTAVQYQDEGVNLGTAGTVDTVNFTGTPVTASRAGNTVTVNVTGGGGSATVTQVVVTLPTPANKRHAVDVTDATVNASSKLILSLAQTAPTVVNEIEDIQLLTMGALPGAGKFTFLADFLNPISGPITLNYMVG